MKSRVLKSLGYTVLSVVGLLVILAGGGVAYTWYVGQNSTVDNTAIAEPVEREEKQVIKPTRLAANANIGVSVQALSSPVAPGSNASITIKTNPGVECEVVVEYNDVPSTDSGLAAKAADEFGVASWTWTVEDTVPEGEWPVEVTCSHKEKSAVVQGDLIVKLPGN